MLDSSETKVAQGRSFDKLWLSSAAPLSGYFLLVVSGAKDIMK